MPYNVGVLVQDGMLSKVRDTLGVEAISLPNDYITGLPADLVLSQLTRMVPTWPVLTQPERTEIDNGIVLLLAAECVERLKTLYAPGESTQDARGGAYDWDNRRTLLRRRAMGSFNRAIITLGGRIAPYRPFQPYGPSKAVAYVSPNQLKAISGTTTFREVLDGPG